MNNALWQLMAQTDMITIMVLLLLLGMSIVCWTLAIYKILVFRRKTQEVKKAIKLLDGISGLEDFISKTAALHQTFAGEILAHYLTDFKQSLKSIHGSSRGLGALAALTEKDWQRLQSNMMQTLEDALLQEESLISVLSVSAQASPLIGLFGTVWGLIHAFLGISATKSADISAVAPGIAEALITTLGGLVVAIPALVLFNYVQNYVRSLEQCLIALTDKTYWIMRTHASTFEGVTHAPYAVKDPSIAQETV